MLPTVLAASAFVGFAAAFSWELFAYQKKVVEWAQRDLQSRADLAAANLEEPLRTQDFRKIHAFGDKVTSDGYRLSVFDANGRGRIFDTQGKQESEQAQFSADQRCGEYRVRLWISMSEVMKPFRRALSGVALAGLVGIAGVLLFFFVTYRQRVRIRELKRLDAFRSEFIADVSHEIKTPLTGILGAVDMLEGNSPLVPMIRKESKRLNSLVQSILDLARLERGGMAISMVVTDVGELVKEIAARYPCEVEMEEGCVTKCDPQLIGQAVSNLIGNAVRHSGSKEIWARVGRDGDGVWIEVEDHGVGIPEGERGLVFERFHRVDPSRAAETGGAGLGLAIVKRIAEVHGGLVSLKVAKPSGCVFKLKGL